MRWILIPNVLLESIMYVTVDLQHKNNILHFLLEYDHLIYCMHAYMGKFWWKKILAKHVGKSYCNWPGQNLANMLHSVNMPNTFSGILARKILVSRQNTS